MLNQFDTANDNLLNYLQICKYEILLDTHDEEKKRGRTDQLQHFYGEKRKYCRINIYNELSIFIGVKLHKNYTYTNIFLHIRNYAGFTFELHYHHCIFRRASIHNDTAKYDSFSNSWTRFI